ncbi:Uncharacterised protein [Mycobacterium tuberculosis]|nr:Uncharacterised protein [Mycobacterium tuberculosis]COY62843.1 Uncharacterised protein [Mycobacterium tuberculosis]CPA47742.1 Uncharacterised protein [Mycobacterium tuberculosis]
MPASTSSSTKNAASAPATMMLVNNRNAVRISG